MFFLGLREIPYVLHFFQKFISDVAVMEVDMSRHPPIPLDQRTIFHFGNFFLVFWVLNF
jgi:hypothetical protein